MLASEEVETLLLPYFVLRVGPLILLISKDYTKIVRGLTYVSVTLPHKLFNTVFFSCLITQLEAGGAGLGMTVSSQQ